MVQKDRNESYRRAIVVGKGDGCNKYQLCHPLSKLFGYFNIAYSAVELDETSLTHDYLIFKNLLNDSHSSFYSKTISIFELSIINDKSLALKHLRDRAIHSTSLFRRSTIGSLAFRFILRHGRNAKENLMDQWQSMWSLGGLLDHFD
jgi:hypothetical protein